MCYNRSMAKFSRRQGRAAQQPDDPYRLSARGTGGDPGGFAWSFGADADSGAVIEHEPGGDGLRARFGGGDGRPRAAAVGRELNVALERWWGRGELPSQLLLRDGLLVLEAGQPLSESQHTLILRTALAYGRGMLTALAHQTDPERTAEVIKEALLDPRPRPAGGSLPVGDVRRLRQEGADGAAWGSYLLQALRMESSLPLEPRRSRAAQLLGQLQAAGRSDGSLAQEVLGGGIVPVAPTFGQLIRPKRRRRSHFWTGVFLLLAVGLIGAAGLLFWQERVAGSAVEQITIPAGTYPISDPSRPGEIRKVQVQSFRLDRTEVTNGAYRACYEAGVCGWPGESSVGGGTNPILEPGKRDFPVTGVSWGAANSYCTWVGQRLPLEEEWEIGAAVAPTSMRRFVYPWGDFFQARVVQAGVGISGPGPVGNFSPGGDSRFGAADMAGNVAEWTATLLEPGIFVVRGGSYQDDSLGLRTDSWQAVPAETAAPWLGFRCATTGQ